MRRIVLLVLLVLLALIAVRCGSSSKESTPSKDAEQAVGAPPAPVVPKEGVADVAPPPPAPVEVVESRLVLGAENLFDLKDPEEDPQEIFGCTTRRHRVRVALKDEVSSYQAWDASQDWNDTPKLTLLDAARTTRADDCNADAWIFSNDGVSYEVRKGGCDREDSPPPGPWTGKLIVKQGDKVLSQRDCGASGSMTRSGWTIAWRPGHLSAKSDKGDDIVVFSDKEETNAAGEVISSESHTLLSVVGPYISYAVEWYAEGGAHPSYGIVWKVVDISQPGTPLDLRELFGSELLYEVLKEDPAIMAASQDKTAPDLESLLASLDGGCDMDMGPQMLQRFAFHHLADKIVGVAVGMSHGCEANRGAFSILPMQLPVPERLGQEIAFANEAGAMMQMLAP
ncbi:MAG: hypothetical protein KDA24_22275 [Deltaproteobacteria bacterium]|nr:hypothetical protein [Deltaproteobacteria bacterium]